MEKPRLLSILCTAPFLKINNGAYIDHHQRSMGGLRWFYGIGFEFMINLPTKRDGMWNAIKTLNISIMCSFKTLPFSCTVSY